MADSLGETIAKIGSDKTSIKGQDDLVGGNFIIPLPIKESTKPSIQAVIIQTKDVSSDTIWGTFNWGASNWDNSYTNSFIDNAIIAPNNIFIEKFIADTFSDGSTTADWGSGECSFTSGEIAVSTSIDYNNGTITHGTIQVDNATNLALYLTADGGTHWESVTNGVSHTFTNTGTNLKWKATASGNATLNSLVVTNYH